jgi:hypothetical protein
VLGRALNVRTAFDGGDRLVDVADSIVELALNNARNARSLPALVEILE